MGLVQTLSPMFVSEICNLHQNMCNSVGIVGGAQKAAKCTHYRRNTYTSSLILRKISRRLRQMYPVYINVVVLTIFTIGREDNVLKVCQINVNLV